MAYNVFRIEQHGQPKLNHVALFVETNADGSGTKYHVTGTILNGMIYESKAMVCPEEEPTYVPNSKTLLGTILQSDMQQLEDACRSVPPPAKQVNLRGQRLDPSKPLRRCGEWVEETTDLILARGIISA